MDEQHRYEINLKQGDLFINLSSDDASFAAQQMDKWCRVLMDDSYVPIVIPPSRTPEPTPTPPPAPPIAEAPPPPPVAVQPQTPQAPPPQQQLPLEYQQQSQPVPPVVQPPPIPQPVAVQAAPAPTPALPSGSPQDAFESVMDSLMKEFDDDAGNSAPNRSPNGFSREGLPPNLSDELPTATSLLELCDRAQAESSEDYLLLSAYYLTYFEQQGRFSLKKINGMLVKSGLTPVNHSVLEATLGQGHLSMVPDLTGNAEVSEYMLTAPGQQAVRRLFG